MDSDGTVTGTVIRATDVSAWGGSSTHVSRLRTRACSAPGSRKDVLNGGDGIASRRALDDTMARARHYSALARNALDVFPASPERGALIEAVDFCTARSH